MATAEKQCASTVVQFLGAIWLLILNILVTQANYNLGCATARAVALQHLIVDIQVGSKYYTYGICGRQSNTGGGLSKHFSSLLPIVIPPVLHAHIIRGWYNSPIWGHSTKEFGHTQLLQL